MNFCTVADKNYLTKALALYQSLCENVEDFELWVLCIDKETFNSVYDLRKPNLLAFSLEYLEQQNPELITAKQNPASKYGTQYSQYCWTLTPWFTNYILKSIPTNGYLFYIDSDIYLYGNPQKILDQMNGASVGIHTHRFTPPFKNIDTGWYNTGIVVFKNDSHGNEMSDLWKSLMLNPKNLYAEDYGTCGDQKYLEVLAKIGEVSIFDNNILHGAPWCCNDLNGKDILWYHFSHFNYDVNGYKDHTNNPPEWQPSGHTFIKPYYDNYYKVIMEMERLINKEQDAENR